MKENPTKKEVYFWNMAGSFLNSLSSVVLLMLVNRMLDIKDSDIFAITFSISQLMATIGMFKVRVFQATDVLEKYSFSDYFSFRMLTCLAMLIASFAYAFINGYDSYKIIILILLCLYKIGDCISDVFQGMFQQRDRLDLAGKACSIKVIIPTILFAGALMLTHNLFYAVLALSVSEFVLLFLYDYKTYKNFCEKNEKIKINKKNFSKNSIKRIFIRCFPLFINSYLISDTFNIPKNAIDLYIAKGLFPNGTQTYYNILFMPAFVMSLIVVIFRPQLTSMARYKNNHEYAKLAKTVRFISLMMGICFVACLIGGWLIGIPVLSLVYGTGNALYQYKSVLLIIIVGGGLNALAYIFDDTITIYRKQKYVVFSYVLSWVFCKVAVGYLMSLFGLNGAAISYAVSMFILMLSNMIIYIICTKTEGKNNV